MENDYVPKKEIPPVKLTSLIFSFLKSKLAQENSIEGMSKRVMSKEGFIRFLMFYPVTRCYFIP